MNQKTGLLPGSIAVEDVVAKRGQSYTAFGYSPMLRAPSLGFNGERCDGIFHGYALGNGYRFYNPQLMRFSSPDSMSPFGKGGPNTYSYCQGDPINRHDKSGHFWELIKSAFKAAPNAAQVGSRSSSLNMLPNEMISKIVAVTEPRALRSFATTSKRMNAVVEETLKTSQLDAMLKKEPTNADQLVLLAKVSKGLVDIPKITPEYYGYSQQKIDKLILKVNREPYLSEINRVQVIRDENERMRLSEEISEAVLAGLGHPFI